jgi:hypothetical protein
VRQLAAFILFVENWFINLKMSLEAGKDGLKQIRAITILVAEV